MAEEAEGKNRGWKIKLIIFVGGTCGSVHTQTFNNNLKELGVVESKRNIIRKGLVQELLNAQDTVLCSYFAQRSGERDASQSGDRNVEEALQGGQFRLKFGVSQRGGQRKGGLQAGGAGEQVDIGIGAERRI